MQPETIPTPTTPTPLIRPLAELRAGQLAEVGGKAANLGELIRAGLPVPGGFCLTTEAYRLAAVSAPPTAERARAALLAAPVPAAVAAAVLAGYRELGADVPVAVRSSATAEDLPHASFAGQQDTYLNVRGEAALLDAVRRCWASLWTDRAVSYRRAAGISDGTVRLAVVVQRMVDAQVAGVLFTANPVTGRRAEAVVDANPGLGESVVSGSVNPDRFVLDLNSGAVRERHLGDKSHAVRTLADGGTQQVAFTGGAEYCLAEEQLRRLAELGRAAQRHFGAPQDLEWALDAPGRLWLTQSRAITTLYPLVGSPAEGTRVYLNATLAQGLVRPLTPMGIAALRAISAGLAIGAGGHALGPLAGARQFAVAGERVFVDLTGVLTSRVGRSVAPRLLDVMEARSSIVLRTLSADPRFAVTGVGWGFLHHVARVLVRYRAPLRFAEGVLWPASARRRLDRFGVALRRRLSAPAGADAERRLDHVESLLGSTFLDVVGTVAPVALGSAFGMFGLAKALAGPDAEPGELGTVLRGLPHNVTTEMDLRLWRLATELRADPDSAAALRAHPAAELGARFHRGELPAALSTGMAGFLRDYGHRAVAEIDVGLPRWADDPTHLFGVLANYLRLDDPARAPDTQFRAGRAQAETTAARLVAAARRRGRVRAALVSFGIRRARELAGLRELPKYHLIEMLGAVRGSLAVLGTELASAGRLGDPDDIFWLDLAQVRRAMRVPTPEYVELVARRREAYRIELDRRHIPRILLSDGTEPEALAGAPGAGDASGTGGPGELVGTAASAGTVTGVARVVHEPVGAHLEPGEILVVPSTDPGWTPLFLTAAALVMEMGGANSHGAVVAREYGIPAVVGVPNATTRISTGMRITVHGAQGRVTLNP